MPLPERPPRPAVFQHELGCLTPEAYERLARRELIYEAHIERLEGIIRATRD